MRAIALAMRWIVPFLLLLAAVPAAAQPAPKVKAELVTERAYVQPGGTVRVALHEAIKTGWHTYWVNPGDSGEPSRLEWKLPPGWKASEIAWPYPKRLPVGPLMNFGYENEVLLPVTLTAPADAKPGDTVTLTAHATWLVCEEVCIPEEADVRADIVIGPQDGAADPLFARWHERFPRPSPWPARYQAGDKDFRLFVDSPQIASANAASVAFFPLTDGFIANAAQQAASAVDGGLLISTASGWKLDTPAKRAKAAAIGGVLVLQDAGGETRALQVSATPGSVPAAPASGIGLLEALLFAFLGGLILNLMPCVLPILSMKALALAGKGGGARGEALRDSLVYALGVLAAFAAFAAALLALRAGGEAVGWGFQLQEPIAVAAFAALMFAIGLNLSGLYEVPGFGGGGSLAGRGGAAGSFFTGVLAVAVAAPCTAPFMGVAMGYALTQVPAVAILIFLSLGAGMAAPFVLLGAVPALRRWLPKPGAWMETLRQVLAFAMYATAIWLVWVLAQQSGADGVLYVLVAALALGFALWAYGKRQRGAGRVWIVLALVGALGAFTALAAVRGGQASLAQDTGPIPHEAYSAERLAALRAEKRGVFVNATAAWCITCLVNEKVALSTPGVAAAFKSNKIAYLKADWTNRNRAITELLQSHGRDGVPLYLYYAPGARSAVVLPQILTEGIVTETLSKP